MDFVTEETVYLDKIDIQDAIRMYVRNMGLEVSNHAFVHIVEEKASVKIKSVNKIMERPRP